MAYPLNSARRVICMSGKENDMSNPFVEEKKFLHILQNVPVAIHACCVNRCREGENTPCQCGSAMVNDALSRLTGYTPRDIELRFNNRISEMILAEDREEYLQAIDELYEYPHEKLLTFRVRKKNGEIVTLAEKIISIRQVDGSVWLYAVAMDAAHGEGRASQPAQESGKRVEIRTFGYFNVIIDGQPIAFQHEKAKELLALLVDRQGKFVSSGEIISCLWEEEPVNENTRSRCRKAAFYLRETLEKYGLDDLIESTSKGYRRIRTEMVDCDLYRYLAGEAAYMKAFRGAYMADYSWAEQTLTGLMYGK